MDVTVAVTIHDHPWMDTTVHTPVSQLLIRGNGLGAVLSQES